MRPDTLRAITTALALFGAACSSDGSTQPATGGAGGSGTGGTSGTGAVAGTGGSGTCTPPNPKTTPAMQTINTVAATVLDVTGAPLPKPFLQVCGVDLCINAETDPDATGHSVISVQQPLDRPRFKFGNGLHHVKLAMPLPQQPDIDLGTVYTAAFPAATGPELGSAATSFTSGSVTLTLAPGTVVEFGDPFESAKQFRAAEIQKDKVAAAVAQGHAFDIVVGLGPIEVSFCPVAQITVPNSAGLPPGSAVETWILGLDITEKWAPYGGWQLVGDGAVSADGASVTASITELSVVGFVKK